MWQISPGHQTPTIDVRIFDSSVTTGAGLSGLVYNTASLAAYYRRGPIGSATAITLATQTVGGAWSSGGFVEIQATNMKGLYRLDLPTAAVAKGADYVIVCVYGATNMVPSYTYIDISPAASAKDAILYATVDNTNYTPTTTTWETAANDFSSTYSDTYGYMLIGRSVVFKSGWLAGRAATITEYSNPSGTRARITVSPALPAAPENSGTFIVV